MRAKFVPIHHAELDRTVDVPATQVPIWQRSGWQPVEQLTEPVAGEPADVPIPDEGTPQSLTEED